MSDNGWIVCKSSKKYQLPRLGDPVLCVGATFTVSEKYSHKFNFGEELEVGKIHSVVRRRESNTPYFKFYNLLDYPDHPPILGSFSFMFNECAKMMSIDVKKTGIKWAAKNTVNDDSKKKKSKSKKCFDVVFGLANRGLYDKEDALDALRKKRKIATRQQASSSSDNDSSDSISTDSSSSDDDIPIRKSTGPRRELVDDSSSSSDCSSSDSESAADDINNKKYSIEEAR